MKKKRLEKHLRNYGCVQLKTKGGHDKWYNPNTKKKTVVPRHKELNTFTGRAICNQLEIPVINAK